MKAQQDELFAPEHKSLQPKRLKNFGHVNPEAIYHAEWRRLNRDIPNLLNRLLTPDDAPTRMVPVSRRDAVVAASIVQWLATNVGSSFVQRCQQMVDEARRRQITVSTIRRRNREDVDPSTPLERRKKKLDAVRKRIGEAK